MISNRYIRTSALCISLCISFIIYATEPSDTVSAKTLDEVEVVGENQRVNLAGTVYIPTKKVKEMADGGIELLTLMQLPQLRMQGTPGHETFTTTDGKQIAYFINGRPASDNELRMMLAKDAMKIEFLDHPSDPIFRGNPYVLNFIVKNYEYGGYSKLTLRDHFNNSSNIFSGILYSKFSYKRLSYDILFSPQLSRFSHSGEDSQESYYVKDTQGIYKEEWRKTSYLQGNNANNQFPIFLRANYTDNNKYIDNTIGFSHSGNPGSRKKSLLSFSNPKLGEDKIAETWIDNHQNSVGWSGQYMWRLPKEWTLVTNPGLTYSHSRSIDKYSTNVDEFNTINNNSWQDSYSYSLDIFTGKSFRPSDYFQLGIKGNYTDSHIEYYGSRFQKERIGQLDIALMPNYQFIVKKFRFGLGGTLGLNNTRIYGNNDTRFTPSYFVNIYFSPNKINGLSLTADYSSSAKPVYMISSIVNQINEYLYQTGNDDLQGPRNLAATLNYVFFPSNFFNMNIYANYSADYNRIISSYDTYLDGHAVIRTYQNSGNFNKFRLGGSFSFKFINGSLSLQLSPEMSYSKSSGIYDYRLFSGSCSVAANYMIKKLIISLSAYSPRTTIESNEPLKLKYDWSAYLSVSWRHKNIHLSMDLSSPWRTNYKSTRLELQTPYYSYTNREITSLRNWSVSFKLSYSFDYGKKIDHSNELQQLNLQNSATLK